MHVMKKLKKLNIIKRGNDQILVISGASGVGKTTTCALLGMLYPAKYVHIPFDRSRASRPGEFGSRHVNLDVMHEKFNAGEYFNIAPVTHGGFAAIRTADINKAFSDGKIAVLEYPIEQIDILEKTFPTAEVTGVELVAPSEEERFRRLKQDHKFTDYRIESDKFGSGRINQYKNGALLTSNDHNLVLITERNKLKDTVYEINRYMRIQNLTLAKLQEIEKTNGIGGVQKFLKSLRIPKHNYTQSEHYEFSITLSIISFVKLCPFSLTVNE